MLNEKRGRVFLLRLLFLIVRDKGLEKKLNRQDLKDFTATSADTSAIIVNNIFGLFSSYQETSQCVINYINIICS